MWNDKNFGMLLTRYVYRPISALTVYTVCSVHLFEATGPNENLHQFTVR